MEALPCFCAGQTVIPAMNEAMIRSLHPPLCQCGNVLSPGHSALQCPTLPEVTQKLAPCPPSQLPQSQLSAQPMKLGKLLCFGMQIPNLILQSLVTDLLGFTGS